VRSATASIHSPHTSSIHLPHSGSSSACRPRLRTRACAFGPRLLTHSCAFGHCIHPITPHFLNPPTPIGFFLGVPPQPAPRSTTHVSAHDTQDEFGRIKLVGSIWQDQVGWINLAGKLVTGSSGMRPRSAPLSRETHHFPRFRRGSDAGVRGHHVRVCSRATCRLLSRAEVQTSLH